MDDSRPIGCEKEVEDETFNMNENILANETTIIDNSFKEVSGNIGTPGIVIINETDTYSSENITHDSYRRLTRQVVQRENPSQSDLDYVDNTPSAKTSHFGFKINRRKSPRNRPSESNNQLLYPEKYMKKLPGKKRKSSHKSKSVTLDGKDTPSIKGNYSKNICSNTDQQMDETCYSQVSVDETCHDPVMSVSNTGENLEPVINDSRYSQISVEETCNNPAMSVNETCNSEIVMGEAYAFAGDASNIRDHNEWPNEDNEVGEMPLNKSGTSLAAKSTISGSDMDITRKISQSKTDSEFDMTCVDSTPLVEKVRYGLNLRKRGKLQQSGLSKSTNRRKSNRNSGNHRKSNNRDSCDLEENSDDIFDKLLNESHEFERNRKIREDLSPAIVRESTQFNIPELYSNEDLSAILSRNRLDEQNVGFLNSIITDSDVDEIDFSCVFSNLFPESSGTNLEETSDNQDSPGPSDIVEGINNVISSKSCIPQSNNHARSRNSSTASMEDITLTENNNQSTLQSEKQASSDSEREFPLESNPLEWLSREHRRVIRNWCNGIDTTELKCEYCEVICESYDQLTAHIVLKHMLTEWAFDSK